MQLKAKLPRHPCQSVQPSRPQTPLCPSLLLQACVQPPTGHCSSSCRSRQPKRPTCTVSACSSSSPLCSLCSSKAAASQLRMQQWICRWRCLMPRMQTWTRLLGCAVRTSKPTWHMWGLARTGCSSSHCSRYKQRITGPLPSLLTMLRNSRIHSLHSHAKGSLGVSSSIFTQPSRRHDLPTGFATPTVQISSRLHIHLRFRRPSELSNMSCQVILQLVNTATMQSNGKGKTIYHANCINQHSLQLHLQHLFI